MKRLALSSFLICGGRDDGYGGLLLHLAGELLLVYYAAEGIGAALPRRFYIKVTGLEVHNDDGDRGLLRRLAGELLLNYEADEGTGAVIPCRLCTSSRRVAKQLTSLPVVFNVVFSHWRRGPQRQGRQWE